MSRPADRALCFAGALCGAAGVAFSAAASHGGGGTMATGASFLLMHAPALLALGLFAGSRALKLSGWLLFVGLALFSADLIVRHYGAERLFPMAAPTGGTLMILGWIAVAIGSLLPARTQHARSEAAS
jgi:uncharacterized membrane protein YgdD (TMEM256/DUF423 family)